MGTPLSEAKTKLTEAVRLFEKTAERAVLVASDPKASRTAVDDARHGATFALAAIGLALKGALKAARPGDPDA